jgi:integrase
MFATSGSALAIGVARRWTFVGDALASPASSAGHRYRSARHLTDSSGPASNSVRTSLSAFCTWLAREGYLDSNPVAFTNRAVEQGARERVLSSGELAAIWRAAADDRYRVIVRLLMLTGLRRQEIGGLCRSEIDLDQAMITLPPTRTKNKRKHLVPLAPAAIEIVKARLSQISPDEELIFGHAPHGWQNWSAGKYELDARIAEQGEGFSWRLHDFRRTNRRRQGRPPGRPRHVRSRGAKRDR